MPAPRNLAVSLTTSRASSSPSCAAWYTVCAVIFAQVAAHQRRQPALGARLERLDRAQRDVGARGVGLEAAVVAALAAAALGVDGRVADLARHVRRAVVQLAVEDDPAADAGADRDADGVPRAARRADPPLAEHRAVGVVVERGGQAQPVVDDLPERQVHPAEVGREQHDAALGVERAGRADADAEDLGAAAPRAGWSAMARSASPTSRSTTSSAPASGCVGSLAEARACAEPSSATLPTTRLVPPMSMPSTNRTMRLHVRHGRHRRGDGLDRQLPHAAVMTQRDSAAARARSRGGRRATRAPTTTSRCAARPEAEGRHRRPEDAPPPACPPRSPGAAAPSRWSPAPPPARSAPRRRGAPARPPRCSARPGAAATTRRRAPRRPRRRRTTTGRVERGGELGIVRPALGAPDRSRRQRHEPRARHRARASHASAAARSSAVRRELTAGRRRSAPASRRARASSRSTSWPLVGPRDAAGYSVTAAGLSAKPIRSARAGEQRQRGRAPRAVRADSARA